MSVKTTLTVIEGASFTNGDKITADPVIRAGTLWCFDLADGNSYPSQSASSSSAELLNLVDGGADASFGTFVMPFAGGGLTFTNSGNEQILLPDDAKFSTNTGGFCAVYWIKFGTQTQGSGGPAAGYFDYTNGDGPFGIRVASSVIQFFVNGTSVYGKSWAADTEPHAYALAMVNDATTGWRGRVYIDGVLVADVAVSGTLTAPTVAPTAGSSFIGDGGVNGLISSYVNMSFYRTYGIDLGVFPQSDLEQLLLDDYSDNAPRFT